MGRRGAKEPWVEVIDQYDDLRQLPAIPSRARVNIRRGIYEKKVLAWLEDVSSTPRWDAMIASRDRLARSLAADQPADMFRFWMKWSW